MRVDAALLDVAGLVLLRVAREEVLEVAVGLEADSVAVVESAATADSDGAASRRVSGREQDATSAAADAAATAARAVRWGGAGGQGEWSWCMSFVRGANLWPRLTKREAEFYHRLEIVRRSK